MDLVLAPPFRNQWPSAIALLVTELPVTTA